VRFLWTSLPGLPKSNGHDAILVMVDRLSKYIPLKHPFTACSTVFLFVKDMIQLHGIFWKEVFKLTGNSFEDAISLSPSDRWTIRDG